jgi:ABC-type polysaccharide/polyol phosphate export permease
MNEIQETVEQVLEKLETRITQLVHRQRTSYLHQRKAISALITYTIILEVIIVAWFYLHNKPHHTWDKLIHASPLLLCPIMYVFLIFLFICFNKVMRERLFGCN